MPVSNWPWWRTEELESRMFAAEDVVEDVWTYGILEEVHIIGADARHGGGGGGGGRAGVWRGGDATRRSTWR